MTSASARSFAIKSMSDSAIGRRYMRSVSNLKSAIWSYLALLRNCANSARAFVLHELLLFSIAMNNIHFSFIKRAPVVSHDRCLTICHTALHLPYLIFHLLPNRCPSSREQHTTFKGQCQEGVTRVL